MSLSSLLNDVSGILGQFGVVLPIGIVGAISWSVWLGRWLLSRRASPLVNDFRVSTSVVVPVFREDPDVLFRCLDSWLAEEPDELVLVVDVDDRGLLAGLRRIEDPRLRVIEFQHTGKRSALAEGIRRARNAIVVLSDSDTSWQPGLLAAVQMPFVDPTVGGVGTRQSVYVPDSSIWRRTAGWMLNVRYLDFVPAMGSAGAVACLSGRTAAYRRELILPMLAQLEHEVFLGRECIAGDDGRLTWLVLSRGYRTVHQDSARADSMFPGTFRAFVRQRLRWSRNSYRCYFTAAWKGWLWKQPIVTQVTVIQIIATPLTMLSGLAVSGFALLWNRWDVLAVSLVWLLAGRAVRGISHLREHPRDIAILPAVVAVTILVALPIKLYAFLTMNTQAWLTRSADRVGGEGQTEASLGARRQPEGAPSA
jgi:N-acetylglucosaminyltransferase